MRILRNYILLVLFTAAPLLSAFIAEYVAKTHGSRVDEAGSHPCYIHGMDVGSILNIMFTVGWFAMITVPAGCIALLAYTIREMARLFSRKST